MTARLRSTSIIIFATAALSSAALFGCAMSPDDDMESTDDTTPIAHPEDDVPGSQIRLQEGTDCPATEPFVTQTPGMDVSGYQGNVAWSTAHAHGARFSYIKATEG